MCDGLFEEGCCVCYRCGRWLSATVWKLVKCVMCPLTWTCQKLCGAPEPGDLPGMGGAGTTNVAMASGVAAASPPV